MLNKTKAALQSCQCHYEKPKQIKHTGVNAGDQIMSKSNYAPAEFIQFFCKAFSHAGRNTSCSLLPQRPFVVKQDFKRKTETIKTAAKMIIFFIAHPFGSMPRDCSSFLRIRFIQVARDESPSLRISSSSCARKSSLKRMGNCGERFSGIDMVYAISNIERVYTSVYASFVKKQRPELLEQHRGVSPNR